MLIPTAYTNLQHLRLVLTGPKLADVCSVLCLVTQLGPPQQPLECGPSGTFVHGFQARKLSGLPFLFQGISSDLKIEPMSL